MKHLHPLPDESRICWKRLDVPGYEESLITRTTSGWQLTGELTVEEVELSARLRYRINCDENWLTRSAFIEGEANGNATRFDIISDGRGRWTNNAVAMPELSGAADIDLGFTPATNTLPILRLGLAVGETQPVRSAWLRFPELRLELLEQTYTREAPSIYRYAAMVDGKIFSAQLDVDEHGRVLKYEGLWVAEPC